MKKKIFSLLVILLIFSCTKKQEKQQIETDEVSNSKEILLIGTFHYNNPGADLAKTKSFDILSEASQLELEKISSSINNYNPTKVFVEWPYNKQEELDSLYQLYLNDEYFKNENLSDFNLKNEIFQLGFKVAKENNLKKVYGIDYTGTTFPFSEVMTDVVKNNQIELQAKIEKAISRFTEEFDSKIEAGESLIELTTFLNKPEMRAFSNYFHNELMLLAGGTHDFYGPLLTSEWYKRNLYMWSLIQKQTEESDERIMVLAGASHTAMFDLFIKENKLWKVKELKDIL
ncbi:DUF5694 domain-containing protein [Sabulilitoribacter arenilitoris]|uniref:DUF5694 domain-containing protein n=1 Tax=Wocania arenilitoris TaxID=2044858 RepID=A0AAE3ERG5_9FLAO|nr:DUF5694 domain-containing protein [Wocania arenilitoris]MCF7568934.1 DUF5694 domain-containing protein [Wocania arenilitoris]